MTEAQQIRNFKDFLQLYNRVTELCFNSCVGNLFSRDLASEETVCVSKCVEKFTNVNHKMLGVYVQLQGEITQKRIAEYEAQQQAAELKATKAAAAAANVTEVNTTSPDLFIASEDMKIDTKVEP